MENIKLKIKELFENRANGVNSIFWGYKTINNEITDQQSIIFTVEEKKPLENLTEDVLISNQVDIGGEIYKTDIVESKSPSPLICYGFQSFVNPIVQEHRKKIRPLKGGVSITNTAYCGFFDIGSGINYIRPYKYGTLGAVVVDNLTNTLVGLTAGHIVSKDISFGHIRNFNTLNFYNIHTPQQLPIYEQNNNGNLFLGNLKTPEPYNQLIAQINESGEYLNISSNDIIGEPKRYIPAFPSGTVGDNFVDAGLFTLKPGSIIIPESNQQLGLLNSSGLLFANSGEILQAFSGNIDLYSAGRTTGPKGTNCALSIAGLFGVISVTGYQINNSLNQTLIFEDVLAVRYKNNSSFPAAEGDSGSVIYGNFDGINKIVGLFFAGSSTNSNLAYACRIDRIASLLDISPWTGDIKNFDNKATKKVILTDTAETGIYIDEYGETYNQAGIISNYILPESDEELGTGPIKPNDMFISYLFGDQGLNSYEAVFEMGLETIEGFRVPNATVSYQIQITNQSGQCCTDTSSCFDPNKTILHSITNKANTASDGSLSVSVRNNSEDGLCFLFKILNVEKPNYNFRPEASSSLETLQIAATDSISDSVTPVIPIGGVGPQDPGPVGGGDEFPGSGGENGDNNSVPTGGDEQAGEGENGSSVTPDGVTSVSGGSNTSSSGTRTTGRRGGLKGCCESILNFDNTEFNTVVSCEKFGKTMRIKIGVEANFDAKQIICKETSLSAYVGFNGNRYFLGWLDTRNILLKTEFFVPADRFRAMTEAPSTPIVFEILGKYNTRNCFQENRKNQFYKKLFKKTIRWDNKIESNDDIGGPWCFGTYEPRPGLNCPAPCCNCCEELRENARQTWVNQCPPSLTSHPECAPFENQQYNEPIWVGCQSICEDQNKGLTLNKSAQEIRLQCEKGIQYCWPCRPLTCLECSIGVESLELLNISPLGLDSIMDDTDHVFKTNILHELSLE